MPTPFLLEAPAARILMASAAIAALALSCSRKSELAARGSNEETGAESRHARNPAGGIAFVGASTCKECHAAEFRDWTQSDHHKAMLLATAENVLGDFGDVTFTHFGRSFRFFKKEDGSFWVNAEDAEGQRRDYKIEYTFGHAPLQQYLIAFPGGRYQALQVCWDSRPKEKGGGRWFHLYPDEEIPPDDELHWTRDLFNWNYMCADCHSTDLAKNYDLVSGRYQTTWSEINVSCEACHGPGEQHVAWARSYGESGSNKTKNLKPDDNLGLVVRLKEPGGPAGWGIDPQTQKPVRTKPLASTVQVETCARCHAHRRPVQSRFFHGQKFHDTHSLTLLNQIHYHADGQIKEEVYVYGSFIQSRMFHHGVRCTDCHHPHTAKTLAPGNLLCARCHIPTKYDTPAHHHHPPGSSGASCAACHMPGKYYMVVDWRLDHSLRVPRPDLAAAHGTPDACTNCHTHAEKDAKWAAEAARAWWGDALKNSGSRSFETLISDSAPTLVELAADDTAPAIHRATALQKLQRNPSAQSLAATIGGLYDPDARVRRTALVGLDVLPPPQRLPHALPLLDDPSRTVRIEAARVLASSPRETLTQAQGQSFSAALAETIEAEEAVADRPGGHMGLALLYTDLGQLEKAEEHYRAAAKIAPRHVPSRVNLAEFLQQTGRGGEALPLLEEAVAANPENSIAHESLGRFFIRRQDYGLGVKHIRIAAELDPDRAPIQYFYGVALNSLGKFDAALAFLQRAHELEPQNREYLAGLATICRDAGQLELATAFAERLVNIDPADGNAARLLQELQAMEAARTP